MGKTCDNYLASFTAGTVKNLDTTMLLAVIPLLLADTALASRQWICSLV